MNTSKTQMLALIDYAHAHNTRLVYTDDDTFFRLNDGTGRTFEFNLVVDIYNLLPARRRLNQFDITVERVNLKLVDNEIVMTDNSIEFVDADDVRLSYNIQDARRIKALADAANRYFSINAREVTL